MLINSDSQKEQFRTEFLTFLTRNKFNLMSFVVKHNKAINEATKLKRNERENYGLIHQRLNACKTIDPSFFQKLVHLVDKQQEIQFIRDKVIISKRF